MRCGRNIDGRFFEGSEERRRPKGISQSDSKNLIVGSVKPTRDGSFTYPLTITSHPVSQPKFVGIFVVIGD
jgi:hypothetical protein